MYVVCYAHTVIIIECCHCQHAWCIYTIFDNHRRCCGWSNPCPQNRKMACTEPCGCCDHSNCYRTGITPYYGGRIVRIRRWFCGWGGYSQPIFSKVNIYNDMIESVNVNQLSHCLDARAGALGFRTRADADGNGSTGIPADAGPKTPIRRMAVR